MPQHANNSGTNNNGGGDAPPSVLKQSVKQHVKSVSKKLSARDVSHTDTYLIKTYQALRDVIERVEEVATDRLLSSQDSTRAIPEARQLNACKKHLHFIGLFIKEIPYPVAMSRCLSLFYERLFHLCFTVVPALDKWLVNIKNFNAEESHTDALENAKEALGKARTIQKAHLENLQILVEHIKIDVIRCFYRFVQCYADHISATYFSQMLIFVFAQMETYAEHRHSTVLISMDFMRINCTVVPEHVRRFAPKLMLSTCKLLVDENAPWSDQEFAEIVQLLAQIISVCMPKRNPYSSCTELSNEDEEQQRINENAFISIRDNHELQAQLMDAHAVIVEELQEVKLSDGALFGLCYITSLLCATEHSEYQTLLQKTIESIKESIESLLEEGSANVNPNFTTFIKPLRKLLQYCRFEHEEGSSTLNVYLVQIRQLLLKIKAFVQGQEDDTWKSDHERSYIKLLCAFMSACDQRIDRYAPESTSEGFLDGNCNTLISDLQEDSLLFIIYSQYIRTLSRMGDEAREKLHRDIIPAVTARVIEELDLSDADRLSEEDALDPETGDPVVKVVADITQSDAHRAITCVSHTVASLQSEESAEILARNYQRLMPIFLHLLDNCFLAIGDDLIDTLGKMFTTLHSHPAVIQDIPVLADMLFLSLRKQYPGDKINLTQDTDNGQDEQEEVVDVVSNVTFSVMNFFDHISKNDQLLSKFAQHAAGTMKSLYTLLCKSVPKTTFHDSDELERIVQSKLSLNLLKKSIADGNGLFKGSDLKLFISCHIQAVRTAVEEEDMDRQVEFMKTLNTLVTKSDNGNTSDENGTPSVQDTNVIQILMNHLEKSQDAAKKHTMSGQHKQLAKQCKDLTALVQRQLNMFRDQKTLSLNDDDYDNDGEPSELEELLGADEEDDVDDEQLYESMKQASEDIGHQLTALMTNYAFLLPK